MNAHPEPDDVLVKGSSCRQIVEGTLVCFSGGEHELATASYGTSPVGHLETGRRHLRDACL